MRLVKYITLLLLAFVSCRQEPVEVIFADIGAQKGVFIACQGNFMYGNASLSFYDKGRKQVFNKVFYARNRAPLGDVAQSLAYNGRHLFVVVNNSGKIFALDPVSLEFRGVVTGLVSPRYIHFINETKAYVSDLYARRITIFNPQTLEKTGYINVHDGSANSTRHSTETFVTAGGLVFVSCWSFDNKILVIDPKIDAVVDSITVPLQPQKMVVDLNGKIWVLTDGSFKGSPAGFELPSLVRIDPETRTIEQIFRWNAEVDQPGDMKLNPAKDSLYLVAGDVFKMPVTSRKLPVPPFIKAGNKNFFSAGVDPHTGEIYLADAIDFSQNAIIYRYSVAGLPVDSFKVGINPGDYFFN